MRILQRTPYFLCLTLLAGCVDTEDYNFDNLEEVTWSPTYALPIATGHLGFEDLLSPEDSATLGVREDDVFFFEYQEQFESDELADLIDIPDLRINRYIQIPAPIVIPANTSIDLPVLEGEIIIDSESGFERVDYKAGELQYTISSTLDLPVQIEMIFPEVQRDGEALTASGAVSGNDFSQNLSLQGFSADLTTGETPNNRIPFQIQFSANNNTDRPIRLAAGQRITADLNLVNQEFSYIEGNFENLSFDLPEMIMQVGPFDEFLKYDMQLAEMDLTLHIHNQYGVPISLSLPEFNALDASGQALQIETSPASPIQLEAAEEPGTEKITSLQVTNGNALIQHDPEEIQVEGTASVTAREGRGNYFITDDAKLVFGLDAAIPLVGSFRDLEIRDTLDADLRDSFDELNIKRMELNTELINEFPLGGEFQIYLLGENQQLLDSLLLPEQTNIIISSMVNDQGDLQDPGVFEEFISISEEKFDALRETTQIILVARLNTVIDQNNERPAVRFKSQYKLHVELGGLIEFESSITP